MSEETVAQDENLRLAELRFQALHGSDAAAKELKSSIVDRKALPFLKSVSVTLVSLQFYVEVAAQHDANRERQVHLSNRAISLKPLHRACET